jgi:RNA polymerase sigma-70 factor (ECF subfamily)
MALDSDNLERLIRESASGNSESYRSLYEHLSGRVFAYVRSRVNTREQATDLTQDVFVELWKALPRFTFHSREQFYAFVFVITKRRLSAFYAGRSKDAVPLDTDTEQDVRADIPGGETLDTVTRALATLDAETREIVVLHHWSRYTFGEIAEMLHLTETAVRVRHHRALKTLHALIQ